MSLERRIEILEKSALFQNLPADVLADLAGRAIEHRLSRGQILFSANEFSDGLYIVHSSSVRAFRINFDGREQTTHVEHAGGTLAEVAVFDNGPYPSTAITEEASKVLFLAKEDVRRFVLQHPEAAVTALPIMSTVTVVNEYRDRPPRTVAGVLHEPPPPLYMIGHQDLSPPETPLGGQSGKILQRAIREIAKEFRLP